MLKNTSRPLQHPLVGVEGGWNGTLAGHAQISRCRVELLSKGCTASSSPAGKKSAQSPAPPRGRSTHHPVPASIKGSGIARGALTMSQRTEEQLRRRANNARRRYRSKRMSSLKQQFPVIPPDVLERATLRQVSVAVRKIGEGQSTLSAFKAGECSSSLPTNTIPSDS